MFAWPCNKYVLVYMSLSNPALFIFFVEMHFPWKSIRFHCHVELAVCHFDAWLVVQSFLFMPDEFV